MTFYKLTAASLLFFAILVTGSAQTAQAANPLAYCKADVARLCPGMSPGGGKLVACLKQHENEVSVGCAKALKAVKTKMGR